MTRRPRSPQCCSARTACTRPSTGSTRRCRCASPTSGSASRRVASDGSRASWIASTTATATSSATCRRGATSTESPTEVLQRNFWFCALDDDAGMLRARPHRCRAHPRRVRLPPRRLVVAGHAGDARAPARRSGRRRQRRAPDHVGERVRAVPSPGPGVVPALTRGRDDARAVARRNARERPDAPAFVEAASGDTLTFGAYDDVSDRMAGALLARGWERGRPRRVPVCRWTPRPRTPPRVREGRLGRRRNRRACGRTGARPPRGAHVGPYVGHRPVRPPRERAHRGAAAPGTHRRRRALVPQLDLGDDRAARSASCTTSGGGSPSTSSRTPPRTSRRTTCSSARCQCRSGSGCGRRTSRRRSPARRASSSSASHPRTVLDAIERHRVTVLAAVSSQFVMMLEDRRLRSA